MCTHTPSLFVVVVALRAERALTHTFCFLLSRCAYLFRDARWVCSCGVLFGRVARICFRLLPKPIVMLPKSKLFLIFSLDLSRSSSLSLSHFLSFPPITSLLYVPYVFKRFMLQIVILSLSLSVPLSLSLSLFPAPPFTSVRPLRLQTVHTASCHYCSLSLSLFPAPPFTSVTPYAFKRFILQAVILSLSLSLFLAPPFTSLTPYVFRQRACVFAQCVSTDVVTPTGSLANYFDW